VRERGLEGKWPESQGEGERSRKRKCPESQDEREGPRVENGLNLKMRERGLEVKWPESPDEQPNDFFKHWNHSDDWQMSREKTNSAILS
jgi:hypothetical protein